MNKRVLTLLAGFLSLILFTSVYAEELKIGVIDVHRLMQESKDVKQISDKLRQNFQPRQEKIVSAQKALDEKIAKGKRDEAILSAADKNKMQEEIMKERRDLQRMEQDYQQDLTMTQNEEMQKFFSKLKKAVDNFAKQENYDLILQKDTVPYSAARVEITDKILKQIS